MCGITGFLHRTPIDSSEACAVLCRMADAIQHRGPDDFGEWIDGDSGVGLGHRRLSVIDLTAAGHQPMRSHSGRFILVFNGEIYNHSELREKMGPWPWRGHSDTETLLAGVQQWGLEETLRQSTGMFAIALWDRQEKALYLARDRMGEKPLYYGWQGNAFLFASELKALRPHPRFEGAIDRSVLELYVRRGYVPSPYSIYAGIRKLVPGTIIRIDRGSEPGKLPEPLAYWSLGEAALAAASHRFAGDEKDAVSELEALLLAAVRKQQISDVPIGAFLSGGVDSSAVVALMQATSSSRVKTYTIGFAEKEYNEADHARAVANHLGTEHTELYISEADALDVIPCLPQIYDEPFADMSQVPTILVSRLARRDVTVVLSGDGGDELFCGYGHYDQTARYWGKISRYPLALRKLARHMLPACSIKGGISACSMDEFYEFLNMQWKGFPNLVVNADPAPLAKAPPEALCDGRERLMYRDMLDYLPDDILVKVDRAAMSTSLETRIPLLDYRIVEFAWRLPPSVKRRDGIGKWPLKQVLYKYVPEHMVNRPKKGFGVPLHVWLRGKLRDWAEDLLSEERIKREGFFDHVAVRGEWKRHLSGKKDRHYALWTILMFQAWRDQYR